ncbi:uroporphyrinogen decarboxylase [Salegentibacter chungangensis]|uniref:Uroporphyrinogen decarboxylase n=1 Tax=Salegentibacter chungangensis TaxID=1335724 RepID=A0ABW3NUI7_9FLAO
MEIFGISLTEWIGYIASFFVAISFFMGNIIRLRIVNSVGCIAFIIYGVLIDSWPVIVTNAVIVGVNFYYLFIDKATHRVKADEVQP